MLAAMLALGAGASAAQSPAEAVVEQLRDQGYVEFRVSRTLLGRIRIVAFAPDGSQREIVFNPATGEILRDYVEAPRGDRGPRILDRSDGGDGPQAASSPPQGGGQGGASQSDGAGDDNRGHGNDPDGVDDDNPGQGPGGHGNAGGQGGGHGPHGK